MEFRISDSVSAKLEYTHTWFSDVKSQGTFGASDASFTGPDPVKHTFGLSSDAVTIGLNFQLGN
jgi:opacity protein-like surface antigen